jgi:type IV secretory pathway VirB10-like protein
MGWSSPNTDPDALLLASVVPAAPPSLLRHGLRALGRFGLAVWSVRTGDVLPWFTSLRTELRWALVACVTVVPVLGFYQSAASSAATRTTQALEPAPARPAAAVGAPRAPALALAEPTPLPAQPQLPAEQAAPAESPRSEEEKAAPLEAASGLEEQAPPSAERSAPQAHKHRKSAKKAKPRATKHTTKTSSRRQHPKPAAE